MEPSYSQPSPAPSDFSLDDLLQLIEKLEGNDFENGERNKHLDEDRKRLDEMFQRLQHDKAKQTQIFNQMNEIIEKQQRERGKGRNTHSGFSLLPDGYILFSGSQLKNHTEIISTPMLFRPVYNPIICILLKFILQHFATKEHPSHPGALFCISGDQGVGKTSLMQILMSTLSDLSIAFDYHKLDDYNHPDEFETKIGTDGEVKFFSTKMYCYNSKLFIHIHDDSPPPKCIEPGHLYLIFTSPDQKRLQCPQLRPGQICYTFRLPTFSLAENAVAMVGCSPTVPFSLLSPVDMELRKEEQQILISIEKDQVERAAKVPFEIPDIPITSQQESAKTHLKAIAKYKGDFMFGLNAFLFNFMKHLVTRTERNPNNRCMTLFLNDVVQMRTRPTDPSPTKDTPSSKPNRLHWATAVKTLTENFQSIDDGLGNVTTPNFSEMTNTPESIETLIKWHVGREADIDPFSVSLCRAILESRNLRTEQERISVIVDWLINNLDIHSERSDERTSFVKYLLRKVVLSDWNDPRTPNNRSRKMSSKRRRSLKLNTAKTESLFHHAMTSEPPHFTIQSEIERLSASIRKANLTGHSVTSVSPTSKDLLTSQIARLKERVKEPDILNIAFSRKVREEANDIWKMEGFPIKERRHHLIGTLIDNLVTPSSFDSHQHFLPSLFVQSESIDRLDIDLRDSLACLLTKSSEKASSEAQLQFIVDELLLHILYTQTDESRPSTAESNSPIYQREMACLACDLLTMIVNLQHETVETRLESVRKEIGEVRDRLSFVLLMTKFYHIARNMNILVTPHSILKGLSQRTKSTPQVGLIKESLRVFRRNLRDIGLSEWVQTATKTSLELIDTPETDCVKDDEEPPTRKMQLEERVVDTVTPSILKNVNGVIKEFFAAHENGHNPVDNPKWLAIVRSMMSTILYLIDAGMSRHEIVARCARLGELLEAVYEAHKTHLQSVADYSIHQAVPDDQHAADYVNDLTIFSTHFNAIQDDAPFLMSSETPRPDPDVEAVKTLQLPRTLQMNPESQNRLERMSIALFSRNLLWFLEMEEDLPFDDECYISQFITEFLDDGNPRDVVHRSFVDFMNMTGLLSQLNFGLKREEFLERLTNENAAEESGTCTLQKMRESPSLLDNNNTMVFSASHDFFKHPDHLAQYYVLDDQRQPFLQLLTRQVGVHLLLWASTELLFKAAQGAASHDSETEKTASSLNVARASIFGPSPRWLASTDAQTSSGMSFLWDGVLDSEDYYALWSPDESNHSQRMSFNTDRSSLVPVLPDFKKQNRPHTPLNAVYSLMGKKTAYSIERMGPHISFVAVSPFVEQIMQSEVIAAIARMTVHSSEEKHFSSYTPVLETKKTQTVTSMPMLTFPKLSNRSVHGSTFPQTPSETKRGETDFYFEEVLQKMILRNSSGFDALIVSRGNDATRETVFMPIQASKSITHLEMQVGMVLIQQLLFQVMCHLEPSERIVALFNSPKRPRTRYCRTEEREKPLPWRTGILGFHMVSSTLQFDEKSLKHMPSILRHRNHPLVTTLAETHSTMTTRDITDTLFADLGHYPTFSTEFDPWTTTLSSVNDLTDHYLTLPFQWKAFYDLFWRSSTYASTTNDKDIATAVNEKTAKDWLDRMVRRTMQELNRVGVRPDDLGESETVRIKTFSSFVLSTTISCRRNELLNPTKIPPTNADDTGFVELVQSLIGRLEFDSLGDIPTSLSNDSPTLTTSISDQRLRSLDKLCRQPCVETRLHIVTRIMSNHAMKRVSSPAQEYLSVLQSEKDGGVFRVPARNNLSAILHRGTVLLDNISPLSDIDTTSTSEQNLPRLTSSPLPPNQSTTQLSTPPSTSPIVSEPPPLSKTLRIPLHSFVLAKYGFSDSIPALYKLTQDQVKKAVTNVTPAPLSRWHPRRVVVDPSLLPQHLPQADSLSLFTTFVHRLFDDAFIPVTTTLSTEIADLQLETFLLSQIRMIESTLSSVDLENHDELQYLVCQLASIQTSDQTSIIFSLLPAIRSSLKEFQLDAPSKIVLKAVESIESFKHSPTLVFAKSGSDFFTSPNTTGLDGVDTTTESRAFPIAFSTGYKETDLREEMKDVFEPLTRLLPDDFPTGRPSLIHVDNEGIKESRKTSSSKNEAEDKARAIVNSAILRMGATSTTPLFVFVVDKDLPDHESLPMSLLSSDSSVGCGMMRQRSLADILWILFLTRISREVMTLPLNTSINSEDFSYDVIHFLSNVL
ncbi:hypothetical protein BLNAU_1039 [Blattamonas nauphoetae]|uniref:Uncharacterized protein n=1 Tax=Blattamonas nauphoetae TaxID=2049346 RepID=A0ABQ9YJL8_9EUKA|nr:hypothetical protein BLNAU_1039 [Blattamonas nauphoetae]